MREMFGGIVEPQSFRVGPRKRPTPQITFLVVCGTALLLGSIEAGQILATADLPLTPHQLIAFLPALPVADIQLPAPPRQTPPRIHERQSSQAGTPPGPPLTPPDGLSPERPEAALPRSVVPGELAASHELPPDMFKTEALPRVRPAVVTAPTEIPHVGGNLKPPLRTRIVNPTYPPIAQAARVQGPVIIEATINANGKVVDAKILRSIPLLDAAALDAVRQWEFSPPMLNGQPTPVIMTVTVNFTLQ